MKHHFADLLDRSGDYWTLLPNNERWADHYADLAEAPNTLTALTLTGKDKNWQKARDFSGLRELTLHEPNAEQLASLADFPKLQALRLSHARPKNLSILETQTALRELVFEYVSGFSELAPLASLPFLAAIHLENLRRVTDFSDLGALRSLRYLSIRGTLDWNQPIMTLDFLSTLQNLEYLELAWVRLPDKPFLFSPLQKLQKITQLKLGMNALPLEEFAYLEAKLAHINGAVRPAFVRGGGETQPIHHEDYRAKLPLNEFLALSDRLYVGEDGIRYERVPHFASLLGKGQRDVYGTDEHVREKSLAHEEKYRAFVKRFEKAAVS